MSMICFFKQKTADELRISDWSSDVCSSDLVEGHTDSTGASAYNLWLSQARAEAVATPMQAGGMRFTADQIIGRGETLPLSSNTTPEGRKANRRVVGNVTPQKGAHAQIRRAEWRARVCQYVSISVVDVQLQKKSKNKKQYTDKKEK